MKSPLSSISATPLLELQNVHAAYVKKEILRGVSLVVFPGEIVALLGGNGSGKSTTLKVVAGLLPLSRGRALLAQADISSMRPHERQQLGIGYLIQGGRVFPDLTVAENLSLAVSYRKSGEGSAPKLGAVFPSLTEYAAKRAGLLSGGQRQMLAIEMVLAQAPRLLLLDEPTAALAPEVARDVLNTLANYVRAHRCAALLVEQNVTEAKAISTRTLFLANGIINNEDTPVSTPHHL